MKIVYSYITKDNEACGSFLSIVEKEFRVMNISGDGFVFAMDEDTKKILSLLVIDKAPDEEEYRVRMLVEEENQELLFNMYKVLINLVKNMGIDIMMCIDTWSKFLELQKMGFTMTEKDYTHHMEKRTIILDRIEKYKEQLNSNDKKIRKNAELEIEWCNETLEDILGTVHLKSKEVEYQHVDGYIDFSELPKEAVSFSKSNIKDATIFREDDNYLYCLLKKSDPEYNDLVYLMAKEITIPNLRINGGKLNSDMGLRYPEQLMYIKDKKTNEIVSYIGITENYGIGLYISQIAVRKDYRKTGLGRIMIQDAIRVANSKNIEFVSAEIMPDNDASLGLFGSFGFTKRDDSKFFTLNVREYNMSHENEGQRRLGN